jgi:hypothetical protein
MRDINARFLDYYTKDEIDAGSNVVPVEISEDVVISAEYGFIIVTASCTLTLGTGTRHTIVNASGGNVTISGTIYGTDGELILNTGDSVDLVKKTIWYIG